MGRISALNLMPEGGRVFLKTNVMGVQNETLTCKPELFCTILNYLKVYHDLMRQDKLIYDSVFHALGLGEPARFSLGHLTLDFLPGCEKSDLKNLSRNDRAIYATLPYGVIQELGQLDLDGLSYERKKKCGEIEIYVLVAPIPFDELVPGGPVASCSIDLCQEELPPIKGHNYFAGSILNLIEGMQKCGAWMDKDKSKLDFVNSLDDKENPFISALPPEIHMREFPCVTVEFGSFLRSLNAKGIYGTNEDIDLLKGYAPDLENIYHVCEISSELMGDMFIKDFMKAIGETNEEATTDDLYFESEWSAVYKELFLAMAFQNIPIENLSARGDVRAKDSLFALFGKIPKSRLMDINIYGYMTIGPAIPVLFTSVGVVIGGNTAGNSTDNFYRVVFYQDFKKYLSEELVLDLSDAGIPEDNPFKLLNNSFDFSMTPSLMFSDDFLNIHDVNGDKVEELYQEWLQSELELVGAPNIFNTDHDMKSGLRHWPALFQSMHDLITCGHDRSRRPASRMLGPYSLPQIIGLKIFVDSWVGKPVNEIWSGFVDRMLTAYKQSVILDEYKGGVCPFGVHAWELLYTLAILNTKYDFVVWTKDMYKDLDNILSNMKG